MPPSARSPARCGCPGSGPARRPRKLLEARLGEGVARGEALRDAIPDYYAQAVREHDVDVIAAPEIEITEGEEAGPVVFDAVVEVRPVVTVPGYDSLRVTMPRPEATDEEIDAQIDRMRQPVRRARDRRSRGRRGRHRHHRRDRLAGRGGPRGPHRRGLLLRGGQRRHRARAGRGPGGRQAGDELSFEADHPDPDAGRPALRGHPQGGEGAGAARGHRRVGDRGLRVRHPGRAAGRPGRAHDHGAQDAGPDEPPRQGRRGHRRPGRPGGARAPDRQRDAPAPGGLQPCACRPRA